MKSKKPNIIASETDIAVAAKALRRKCPAMKSALDIIGSPPLRLHKPGLPGLARIVVAQQVSAPSARAIWTRLDASVGEWHPATVLSLPDENLRMAGLSRPKIRTLQALAAAIENGDLDLTALSGADDDAVRDALTQVRGIGPWTADIYLMFCLGRADSFAPGDLALMTATAHLMQLSTRPESAELIRIAERWRPWRAVAARILWAYHPTIKDQSK